MKILNGLRTRVNIDIYADIAVIILQSEGRLGGQTNYDGVDLHVNPFGPMILFRTSLNAEKCLMPMHVGGACGTTSRSDRGRFTTSLRGFANAMNTQRSSVSSVARTAKGYGEVNVSVFLPTCLIIFALRTLANGMNRHRLPVIIVIGRRDLELVDLCLKNWQRSTGMCRACVIMLNVTTPDRKP
jgi:hypothetical protein